MPNIILSKKERKKINKNRQKFLILLNQSIEDAGPEDYNELEFDD
ncbi:MAG: hypothetical protein ACTSVV_01600 [Promethearchaeota archaeon]